jgi:hypothetical protein
MGLMYSCPGIFDTVTPDTNARTELRTKSRGGKCVRSRKVVVFGICLDPQCSARLPVRKVRMSVENPGEAEVAVDMVALKASLTCPLCDDMYRFPVTVVRFRSWSRGRLTRAFLSAFPPRRRPRRGVFPHSRVS